MTSVTSHCHVTSQVGSRQFGTVNTTLLSFTVGSGEDVEGVGVHQHITRMMLCNVVDDCLCLARLSLQAVLHHVILDDRGPTAIGV